MNKKKRIKISLNCKKCKKVFEQEIKEDQVRYIREFCSTTCANSREIGNENTKTKKIACFSCGKTIEVGKRSSNKNFCKECKKSRKLCLVCKKPISKNNKTGFCIKCIKKTEIGKAISRKAGQNSAKKRVMRSFNEICFYELCQKEFKNVIHNKPIFNGWDADVILMDQRIAILWNGPWHYKQCSKNHHVNMVQNRDKIKIEEIKKCGFKEYVIIDTSKRKDAQQFVENEFLKLLKFITVGSFNW